MSVISQPPIVQGPRWIRLRMGVTPQATKDIVIIGIRMLHPHIPRVISID